MKRADVDVFEKLTVQLDGIYQELSILAKKTPNGAVNAFKLSLVNNILRQCNQLLGEKYKPFAEFETFSQDELPSSSDVTFIISQYIECAEKFRADHVRREGALGWTWRIDDDDGPIVNTSMPKKLLRKD